MADFGENDPIVGATPGTNQSVGRPKSTATFGSDDVVISSPSTLSEGVPTAEQRAAQSERERLAQEAYARFQALSPRQQFVAGARHTISSMPFLRHLIDTTDDQGVADMRTGLPGVSRGFEIAGHSLPYVATGAGLPALFSTLPRAALTSGAIEGGDTAVGGGDAGEIARSVAVGAAGAIPGYALGRAITPRNPQSAFDTRFGRAGDVSRSWRRNPELVEDVRNEIAARRYHGGRDPDYPFTLGVPLPTRTVPTIPRIPSPANVGLGGLGAYVGHQLSGGDVLAALAGAGGLPLSLNIARGAANAGIRRMNEALATTRPGQAVGSAVQGYSTNQALPPEARAVLHSLSTPAITPALEAGAETVTGNDITAEMLLAALLAAPAAMHETLRGR